ncbi:unnamed protein product [Vicia faba]|uniref:Borealin N-terminal domain-containing protein n=1 Tax=Vicia faba TaxID=3906 RepID=A0AAV1AE51_VICFA|nr:unnamed protein product [Vicia faba]
MIEEEKLEAEMVERIDAIEVRMGGLEEAVKSFKLEFRQLLRTKMPKHLGHIPVKNLSSGWSVFPITNAMKEHCVAEFQTDVKSEAAEKKEISVANIYVILAAEPEKPEKKMKDREFKGQLEETFSQASEGSSTVNGGNPPCVPQEKNQRKNLRRASNRRS